MACTKIHIKNHPINADFVIYRQLLDHFLWSTYQQTLIQLFHTLISWQNFNHAIFYNARPSKDIIKARKVVNQVYVDDKLKNYIIDLVNATRYPEKYNMADMRPLIQHGASPRATISLLQSAKAHAFVNRRGFVTPEDVKSIG